MSGNRVLLDRDYILRLFKLLDDKMFAVDLDATIYIVGGAAIATTVNELRVTTDIDGKYEAPQLDPLICQVADEEGLENDWLNHSVTSVLSYFKKDLGAKTIFTGKKLCIQAATPDYILAMKLASRREKDIEDVVFLANELGLKNRKDLVGIAKRYFNADLSAAAWQHQQIKEYIDLLIEEGHLAFPD